MRVEKDKFVQTESSHHCFHSKQIGAHHLKNPDERLGLHIESCVSCKTKLTKLIEEQKLLESSFKNYQIPEDVKRELKQELEEVFDSFTPKLKDKIAKSTKELQKEAKTNLFHFLVHFFNPTHIKLIVITVGVFLIARSLINA